MSLFNNNIIIKMLSIYFTDPKAVKMLTEDLKICEILSINMRNSTSEISKLINVARSCAREIRLEVKDS